MNTVYLSRRNLLTLLRKLDDPTSARTLVKRDVEHPTYPCSTVTAVVAVEDDYYYVDREPGPVTHEP